MKKKLTKEQFELAFELVGKLQGLGLDTSSTTMHMCELAPDDDEDSTNEKQMSELSNTLRDLIDALEIFLKYKNTEFPTMCEHDVLFVVGFSKDEISKEDQQRLNELGFKWSENDGGSSENDGNWISFRFGSA